MPKTGTSIENGATVVAPYRLIRKPQAPKPARVEISATKSRARTAETSVARSAARSVAGPSTSSESTTRGGAATALTHTMNRNVSAGAALRVAMFDRPHATAAPTTSRNAPNGKVPLTRVATTPMPAAATASPATCTSLGRSRSSSTAKIIVKTAWLCRTSELSPAGIPAAIPANSSENLVTHRVAATARIQRHGTWGRPAKNTAGTAARVKRRALSSRGG